MKPVKLLIIGAGSRGTAYASYALKYPDQARIIGVSEPREYHRLNLANQHNISNQNTVTHWEYLSDRPKFADAVIIATQDMYHVEPAIHFAEKGYHILLEKPMAPNEADCRKIVESALSNNIIFGVCHVLRYTPYIKTIKSMVDSGVIGDIVSIQRLEPVGYWHQAHSFVRGNWRKESESSSMLLAKSCHDLDWIRYLIGVPCKSISSFGTLKHFRKSEKPKQAGDCCLDCNIESQCPYSAKKIYLNRVKNGETGWPVDIIASPVTEENVIQALREGPYGRCVYACDNDVVDHQVVNMLFDGGQTASFTMTAFTEAAHRKTRIFGTKGEIEGNGSTIRHFDFLTDTIQGIETNAPDHSIVGGHGGGDQSLLQHFVAAVAHHDPKIILSGPEETLESHLMVFAAEEARRENKIVNIQK